MFTEYCIRVMSVDSAPAPKEMSHFPTNSTTYEAGNCAIGRPIRFYGARLTVTPFPTLTAEISRDSRVNGTIVRYRDPGTPDGAQRGPEFAISLKLVWKRS
jgi:hypothetical protein